MYSILLENGYTDLIFISRIVICDDQTVLVAATPVMEMSSYRRKIYATKIIEKRAHK